MDHAGNVYVTDTLNYTIRKITPAGVVSTLAGTADHHGPADGQGRDARFYGPRGVALTAAGDLLIADSNNNTIRKVTPDGFVSTLAGLSGGAADGVGEQARFYVPSGVAVDTAGNIFVADTDNHTIRKITPDRRVTTLAGLAGFRGSADGPGSSARFYSPGAIAVDAEGFLFVSDTYNRTVRKISPDGVVSTFAGMAGKHGSTDGPGQTARFSWPHGLAFDAAGNLYVADSSNRTIRKITREGVVTTFAGLADSSGTEDGLGSAARFNYPAGLAIDGAGNLYVTEKFRFTIRKITPEGLVTTLAGQPGSSGSADGDGATARFFYPFGIAADRAGNLYVADGFNHIIRMVTPSGFVTTVAGVAGAVGSADGIGSAASLFYPGGVAVDPTGNVYIADTGNNTIRLGKPLAAPPALEIALRRRQAMLSWPAAATGFILETTDALPPTGAWSALKAEVVKVGDRLTVAVEVHPTTRFFRLRRL